MKQTIAKDFAHFKEVGEKYDTYKLAKSHNLGRVVLAALLVMLLIFSTMS